MRPSCGRLGCDHRATQRVKPQYGPDVLRCDGHVDETVDVYNKFDNRQSAGTHAVPLVWTGYQA